MRRNSLETAIKFIIRYIWLFCILLIAMELVSSTYTANVLMKQSAQNILTSVCGEVSGRVDGVLRLLEGMSEDARMSDLSVPLFDRAILGRPYQKSYDLYMVAMTDENANVISCDETEPPKEPYSLAYRDYMQRLFATGEYQITDAFLAGADNKTRNYTIAVPILKDGKAMGTVFGSIYFEDIENTLQRSSEGEERGFYMMGREDTVMVSMHEEELGLSFSELMANSRIYGGSLSRIESDLHTGTAGSYWEWGSNGLYYVSYMPVAPTEWNMAYQVRFSSVIASLLPVMLLKVCLYVAISALVATLGRRYLHKQLSALNHLVERMTVMQKELFQNEEQPNYDNLLSLTQSGLTDQLTGLATRAVFLRRLEQLIGEPKSTGAVFFVDLDDLKRINDTLGHEAGDCALLCISKILKGYEQAQGGVAARYGGDEFLYAVPLESEERAERLAEELCAALRTTATVKDRTFPIHGSVGVSFFPRHGRTTEELICKADLALYAAKQGGKARFTLYDETAFHM